MQTDIKVLDRNIQEEETISIAQKYYLKAEELRQNLRYKESVDSYLQSILMDRENYTSYLGLAIAYKNLKNYNKAITNLEKADKLKPYDVSIQKELALCNIIKGEFCAGIKHLITSIKLDPQNLDLQMQLALVHEMIEEEDMALMIYQKIIETDSSYIRAYIQKATLYMHIEDYLSSAKMFIKIIKLNPNYHRAYLALAICYEKMENLNAAKRFYKKYISLCKDHTNYFDVIKRIREINVNSDKKISTLKLVSN